MGISQTWKARFEGMSLKRMTKHDVKFRFGPCILGTLILDQGSLSRRVGNFRKSRKEVPLPALFNFAQPKSAISRFTALQRKTCTSLQSTCPTTKMKWTWMSPRLPRTSRFLQTTQPRANGAPQTCLSRQKTVCHGEHALWVLIRRRDLANH